MINYNFICGNNNSNGNNKVLLGNNDNSDNKILKNGMER